MRRAIFILLIQCMASLGVMAAYVPENAPKALWGEIEYACFADSRGFLTVARRIPGETEWETRRTRHRAAGLSVQFAIDGNGRIHAVFGNEGAPLRYAFSIEPGGMELSPSRPMTGDRERRVFQPRLMAFDDGSLTFIYNSGTVASPAITVNWFSLYDGQWERLHDSLFDPSALRGMKIDIGQDASGEIRLHWKPAKDASGKDKNKEAISPDGGLTWMLPDGTPFDLPIR